MQSHQKSFGDFGKKDYGRPLFGLSGLSGLWFGTSAASQEQTIAEFLGPCRTMPLALFNRLQ